ncbi:MAG: 50S ribosomal protein L6 [Spirochaetia bacterium]|nr:50S ribosomal protein L6 [Spirochaetia bacterium]
MSRIGKKPVIMPEKVKAVKTADSIKFEGPKGKAEHRMNPGFEYSLEGQTIKVAPKEEIKTVKNWNALFGMERATIANKVAGVNESYVRTLVLKGVGYRATLAGQMINFTLGYSHPVNFKIPEGITAQVLENQTKIVLTGNDKHIIGQAAAEIKHLKLPEPYQGKGVMFEGERIRRKAGKSAAGAKK